MYDEKPAVIFKKYALPQMIGLVLNSLYFIVDGVFIGNRLGRDSLAAAAIGVPFLEFLIALALMIAVGGGVLISYKLGQEHFRDARKLFNKSLVYFVIVSVIIVLFGNIFIDQLAHLLGSTTEICQEATTYLWYIITFSPFLLFSFGLSSFARSDNKPKLAMYSLVVGSITNIILDYLFMYPLNMGIAGAALATAIGPIVSVIILMPHFITKKGNLYIDASEMKIDKHVIKNISKLGMPTFVMEFSIGIVTFIYNFFIIRYSYNEIGLASYLLIGYLVLIILTMFLGIGQGLQPVVSYLDGRNNKDKILSILKYFIKVTIIIGIVFYLLILIGGKYFFTLFAGGDQQLIDFSVNIANVYFIGFVFAGINILSITFLQSLKKTRQALFLSLLRSIVLLPILMFILPKFTNNDIIWLCVSIVEMLTFFYAVYLLKHQVSK